MAEISGMTDLEAREAEVEEARARLSKTLGTLTSPETQAAMKAEVLGHVQVYKDELLKQADRYKDELLQKADEYKGELLDRAEVYKTEVLERAEQYKGEFLSRADEYKNEALERAEAYKNEALQRARDAGRQTVRNVAEDLKARAMNNPAAVALIGAGVGYRLYKHPPITTLLVGAGVALLMRTPGRSAQDDRSSYRDPYRETQPRGYVPGGVAGYGYPVEENAPGSSTAEQWMTRAADAGTSVRNAAYQAGAQVSDAAERAGSAAASTAEAAFGMANGLARTIRRNPLLLALTGLAAGAAIARSVRATESGQHLVQGGADVLGRGAREVTSRVSGTAGQAVEGVGGAMSAAVTTASEAAAAVKMRVPELVSGITEGAGRAATSISGLVASAVPEFSERSRGPAGHRRAGKHRKGSRRRQDRRSGVAHWASGELVQMAERYPLLLSSLGLVIGVAAGAVLRPSAAEDRYLGGASDALKRRTQQKVADQLEQVVAVAGEVFATVEEGTGAPADGGRTQDAPSPPSVQSDLPDTGGASDTDRTFVVVERAEDAAAARAAVGGADPAR